MKHALYQLEQRQKQHFDAPVEEINTSLEMLPGDSAIDFKQDVLEVSPDGTVHVIAKIENKEELPSLPNKGLDIFEDAFEMGSPDYRKILG